MFESKFLKVGVGVCLLVGACSHVAPRDATPPAADDVESASISSLRRSLETGRRSSETMVLAAAARAEDLASGNAFITLDKEGALAQARRLDEQEPIGVLHGIPIVVKDNVFVAGMPNTAGTPLFRDFVPIEDATAVARLREAGAIVLGKTNMHELAFGITSANAAFGAVGNAHAPDFIAGGSSGGTAAAIASGIVVAGLGTDTGGSGRIPAALNGIVGFRPTMDRYPTDGVTRISSTRDTIAPMGRTVADVALLDSVMTAHPTRPLAGTDLSGLRFGVAREYFYADLEPGVETATERLLVALEDAGVELIEAEIDGVGEQNAKVGFPIVMYEARHLLSEFIEAHVPNKTFADLVDTVASPDVAELMKAVLNQPVSQADYEHVIDVERPRLQHMYRRYFADNDLDALIFPTTPLTARQISGGTETVWLNGERVPTFLTYIRNTDPGSNAGIPGLSIPLGKVEGLPFGIEIDGPAGHDEQLLAIGQALESFIATIEF